MSGPGRPVGSAPTDLDREFVEAVREVMKATDVTPAELADVLEVSRSSIYYLLSCKHSTTLSRVDAVAAALGRKARIVFERV